MKIGIVGTGYVGLVTGALFADVGNKVICLDKNPAVIQALESGKVHFFEPGLEDYVKRNVSNGNLRFTSSMKEMAEESDVYFLCVGTPSDMDGSFNLSYVKQASYDLANEMKSLKGYKLVVVKSTVPQRTHDVIKDIISKETGNSPGLEWDYVSNPETLAEGRAVADFNSPSRVILGVDSDRAFNVMREIYNPFVIKNSDERIIRVNPVNAELIKLGSNSALATRVAFINEMARIADTCGGDIKEIRKGIISDPRIGKEFLFPGPGYGGSCFPKDVEGLMNQSKKDGFFPVFISSVHSSNEHHKKYVAEKSLGLLNKKDAVVAVWGVTFKAGTDDVRNAPSIEIISRLVDAGVKVNAYDPQDEKARLVFGDNISFFKDKYEVLKGADALIHITDWNEFFSPDFKLMKSLMKGNVLLDLRNRWIPEVVNSHGFDYYGMGRNYPL